MSLPWNIEELRDTLNRIVELEEQNARYSATAIEDASTIAKLSRVVAEQEREIRVLESDGWDNGSR